jgi:hypothetical protein
LSRCTAEDDLMAGLLVTPAAGIDDLDREIKKAERDYHAAFADQQALGRDCSTAEAKALAHVEKTLATRLNDLRAKRILRKAGLDDQAAQVAQPTPSLGGVPLADRDTLQKLIDARIERHRPSARTEYRGHRIVVTKQDANGRILEFEKVPIPIREPVDSTPVPGPLAAADLPEGNANNDNGTR